MRGLHGIAVAALGTLLSGCGGGGGGDAVVPTASCIEHTATYRRIPGVVWTATAPGSSCDVLKLDVVLLGFEDVYGAEFRLHFDPSVLKYESSDDSVSFLREDQTTVQSLIGEEPGIVVVGITRVRGEHGVNASEEAILIRLTFSRKPGPPRTFPLEFSNAYLFGSETPPQVKDGVEFRGGEVRLY